MTNKEAKEILEWELSNFKYTDNEFVEATKVAIKALEERPKGKWIEHEDEKWGGVWYTCSNCYQDAPYEQDVYNNWRQKLSDFCPTCGARMESKE